VARKITTMGANNTSVVLLGNGSEGTGRYKEEK